MWSKRAVIALVVVSAVGVVGNALDESSTAATVSTAPVLVASPATSTTYTAPVSRWSGSTAADVATGWTNVEILDDGRVMLSGVQVDNVTDTESPLRARYLRGLSNQHQRFTTDEIAVREGLSFCLDLKANRTQAQREAYDANADEPRYSTSPRRVAVAASALTYFCPSS